MTAPPSGLGWIYESGVRSRRRPGSAVARLFSGGTVLCDGAMGSMLYGRGHLHQPLLRRAERLADRTVVRAVHTEYLQAGAIVIETNTFGANRVRLERYGFEAPGEGS